jgi:HSP20 family protein
MGSQYRKYTNVVRRVSSSSGVSQTIEIGRQWTLTYRGQVWRPPTDVYETNENLVIQVEIAGVSEDNLHITFGEHRLIIDGVRSDTSAKLGYHQMEIAYGQFRTELHVPVPVDADKITAAYQDGFLIITMPKS